MSDFEGFLTERNDVLNEAARNLLWHMTHPNVESSETEAARAPYTMAQIGPILDAAEQLLQDAGHDVCHPYYGEIEMPCYLEDDCGFSPCPMRESQQDGGKQNE